MSFIKNNRISLELVNNEAKYQDLNATMKKRFENLYDEVSSLTARYDEKVSRGELLHRGRSGLFAGDSTMNTAYNLENSNVWFR